MAERTIPNIPKYRGDDPDLGAILDKLREAVERIIDTDFVTEKDIYCRDLVTSENSIYIGEKSPRNRLEVINGQLIFAKKKMDYEETLKAQSDKINELETKINKLDKDLQGVKKNAI